METCTRTAALHGFLAAVKKLPLMQNENFSPQKGEAVLPRDWGCERKCGFGEVTLILWTGCSLGELTAILMCKTAGLHLPSMGKEFCRERQIQT